MEEISVADVPVEETSSTIENQKETVMEQGEEEPSSLEIIPSEEFCALQKQWIETESEKDPQAANDAVEKISDRMVDCGFDIYMHVRHLIRELLGSDQRFYCTVIVRLELSREDQMEEEEQQDSVQKQNVPVSKLLCYQLDRFTQLVKELTALIAVPENRSVDIVYQYNIHVINPKRGLASVDEMRDEMTFLLGTRPHVIASVNEPNVVVASN